MKDGAIVANTGHFNVEIDIPALEKLAKKQRKVREFVEEYTLADGRNIYLLGEGRLINLAAAEGHPSSVMDMSFANQALRLSTWSRTPRRLEKRVYDVPEEHRPRDREAQAGFAGRRHRQAHRRAGEVPGQLAHGDLSRRGRQRAGRRRAAEPPRPDPSGPSEWRDGVVELIDQRRLPLEEVYVRCETWQQVADAIRDMAVRGAPAIGVTAAMGMALAARAALRDSAGEPARFRAALQAATKGLGQTRPTAYNLFWALAEMQTGLGRRLGARRRSSPSGWSRRALEIHADDVARCRAIGDNGAALIQGERVTILTHCNAGALATAGYGTALGVIRSVYARDPGVHVLVDETRPLLQGARLDCLGADA